MKSLVTTPDEQVSEMKVAVTYRDFHGTHDKALAARKLVRESKSLKGLETARLNEMIAHMQSGQRLTDAEDGPDFMFASDYNSEIRLCQNELASRKTHVGVRDQNARQIARTDPVYGWTKPWPQISA